VLGHVRSEKELQVRCTLNLGDVITERIIFKLMNMSQGEGKIHGIGKGSSWLFISWS
jgi:hypothetical protein